MNDEDSISRGSRKRPPAAPRDPSRDPSRDPWDLIVPYVDGECDALERSWLEEKMLQDPRLAREVGVHARLRDSLALVYRRRATKGEADAESRAFADRVRRSVRLGHRRRSIVTIAAAAAVLMIVASVVATVLRTPPPSTAGGERDVAVPSVRPPASRSDAEFLDMLQSLDVLETLLDEEVDVTPELTQLILSEDEGEDGAVADEPVDEQDVLATDAETLFDYLLEEELMWEY